MALSKEGAKLIDKAGRGISEKEIREMIKRDGKIYNVLSEYFDILGESVQIICPDNIQKYSLSFSLKEQTIPNNLKFEFGKVKGIKLQSIKGLKNFKDAVQIQDIGFTFFPTKLEKDLEYLLEVDYQFEDHRFMKAFINTDKSKDAPYKEDEEVSEYWLEAHLKHPDLLRDECKSIDLQDVDVGINVSVGQDLYMKIPSQLKEKMDVMVKLYKGGGRSETWKNAMRLHSLQRGQYSGDSMDVLNSLQEFFTATVFSKYIDVKQDFSYHDCYRGSDFHENLPIHS